MGGSNEHFEPNLKKEMHSNSLKIETILFFKESFSFNTKSSLEDKTSLFFKTISKFYFSKFPFPLWQGQVGISMSPFHLKSQPSLIKQIKF